MPWPRAVARLNKRYTNRFIEPVVSRLPGFVVVHHRGRLSGTRYATPLYAFDASGGFLVALTYGISADWAQNVLASCGTIDHKGSVREITNPVIVNRDQARPHIPSFVRVALRLLRVRDFMLLETSG